MTVRNRVLLMQAYALSILVVMTCVLAGCASVRPLAGESLDPLTGVTTTYSHAPLVLYRDVGAAAAFAREMVNIGPVLVNRSGDRRYFLWLGAWTTNTGNRYSTRQSDFESVVLLIDGEPMILDAAGWLPADIGISEPAYIKPVATTTDVYYRVTEDQVRLLAQSADIRLLCADGTGPEYVLWVPQRAAWAGLDEFIALTMR